MCALSSSCVLVAPTTRAPIEQCQDSYLLQHRHQRHRARSYEAGGLFPEVSNVNMQDNDTRVGFADGSVTFTPPSSVASVTYYSLWFLQPKRLRWAETTSPQHSRTSQRLNLSNRSLEEAVLAFGW
eukprot:6460656-Amphidinium_carterae.1